MDKKKVVAQKVQQKDALEGDFQTKLYVKNLDFRDNYIGQDKQSSPTKVQGKAKEELKSQLTRDELNESAEGKRQEKEYSEFVRQCENNSKEKVSLEDFEMLKVLGVGAYGKVFLVTKISNQVIYAMKVIKKERIKTDKQKERTRTERSILEKIKHPFIMNLQFAFQTPTRLYMVIDYCPGGELFFHLQNFQKFNEKITKFYSACILLGLEELHKLDIIYRDLKPENILIDKYGYPVITDFGLCKEGVQEKTQSFCGTAEYMAPEIILKQPYSKSVDWWSFGIIIYEMLCGLPPFYTTQKDKLFQRILQQELTFPAHVSANAQSLLTALINRQEDKRLGAGITDAEEIKNHVFYKDVQWDKLMKREIKPPFVPLLKSPTDVDYFSKDFTDMNPLQENRESVHSKAQSEWSGFTYQTPLSGTAAQQNQSGVGKGQKI